MDRCGRSAARDGEVPETEEVDGGPEQEQRGGREKPRPLEDQSWAGSRRDPIGDDDGDGPWDEDREQQVLKEEQHRQLPPKGMPDCVAGCAACAALRDHLPRRCGLYTLRLLQYGTPALVPIRRGRNIWNRTLRERTSPPGAIVWPVKQRRPLHHAPASPRSWPSPWGQRAARPTP